MRKWIAFRMSLVLFLGAWLSSASAVEKIEGPKLPPSANKVSRLTTDECEGLGGTVAPAEKVQGDCKGLAGCILVDSDGVQRRLCIDEQRH
jgi:hypothetical protein